MLSSMKPKGCSWPHLLFKLELHWLYSSEKLFRKPEILMQPFGLEGLPCDHRLCGIKGHYCREIGTLDDEEKMMEHINRCLGISPMDLTSHVVQMTKSKLLSHI